MEATVRNKLEAPSKGELMELKKTRNYTEIGRDYDVSRTTVKRWFEMYSMYPRNGKSVPVPAMDALDKLIVGGMNNGAIAEHYQVHVTTVTSWLKNYGLLSKQTRERIREITEKLEDPKYEAPEVKIDLLIAASNAHQYIGWIEHQFNSRATG